MYILVVLKPRLSYNDWTKLEIFLGSRPTLLMIWLASILPMRLCSTWTYNRKVTEVGCLLAYRSAQVDWQHIVSASGCIYFSWKWSSEYWTHHGHFPHHTRQQNSLFARRMVMWSGAYIEVHVHLFLVDCMVQMSIMRKESGHLSPSLRWNRRSREGHLDGPSIFPTPLVWVAWKQSVIHIPEPAKRLGVTCHKALSFKSSIHK